MNSCIAKPFCVPCAAVYVRVVGLLAVAMIPLIAVAGVIQLSMVNGGYGDTEVNTKKRSYLNCA